jgi:hypothetical protein
MDPQFQELAAAISSEVSETVKRDLTAVLTRDVSESVKRDVTDVLRRDLTDIVKRDVTEALKEHVTDVVTAAEKRLADQARGNVEAVKAEARLAAEGYGGVLQAIDTRLSRLETDLAQQFGHHTAVLKNHNERITSLEHKIT